MPTLLNLPIKRCRPSEDVVPFSECRQNFSSYINRPRETHRPILITQNGQAASLLIDVSDFEKTFTEVESLREQAELSMAVAISREQFKRGESFSTDDVFAEVNDMLLEGKRTGKYK